MKLTTIARVLSVVGIMTLFKTWGGTNPEQIIAMWLSIGFLLTAGILEFINYKKERNKHETSP